jgi:predicted  nucleic acid-binding Zn-ribbon protein
MTEAKAIKISKETYAKLCEIAGELQIRKKRPVSIEEAMQHLIKQREKGMKITDLAGSWSMTDKEFKEISESINGAWERWMPQTP